MLKSLNALYSYKKELVKIKNLFRLTSRYKDSVSFDKTLMDGLSNILGFMGKIKKNISDIFAIHEDILKKLYLSLKNCDVDKSDFILCMNTVDDLLNSINYQIKTIEADMHHMEYECMELFWEDHYTQCLRNKEGIDLEIRTKMYDKEYGIDYVVFTDYQDREYEERYFVATYIELSENAAVIFSITPEEKEHYIADIALYDEIDEVLDYFDFYY
jgi:hypothetical protein